MIRRVKKERIVLCEPDSVKGVWNGDETVSDHLKAAWTLLPGEDYAMMPCLIGSPGSGKTVLAYNSALFFKKPFYIFQCTRLTDRDALLFLKGGGPEDQNLYASPLLSAMLEGAVCVFENAEVLQESVWFDLKSLIDDRHYILSDLTGQKFVPKAGFRAAFLMSIYESSPPVPEQILSSIVPLINIREEKPDIEKIITDTFLRGESPQRDSTEAMILKKTVYYVDRSQGMLTVKDGMKIFEYCTKLMEGGKRSVEVAFEQTVALLREI